MLRILAIALLTATATAQWQLQQSHTTASLRGIHALGNGVAWASGTGGTVLRTTDDGTTWQPCAIPPAAEHLDFRGIQAFDTKTAIVMSSGKGDLSRLYKTTDACQTWKLVFTNPDKEGFWDAIVFNPASTAKHPSGDLVGDPVGNKFPLWSMYSDVINRSVHIHARKDEAAFAASNSSLFIYENFFWLATGGRGGSHVIRNVNHGADEFSWTTYPASSVPVGNETASSGIFSIQFGQITYDPPNGSRNSLKAVGVAVGGDYLKIDESSRTAAFTSDAGEHWLAAQTPPHGYRSAVAYSPTHKAWITVGPNGTDLSTDDGHTWRPLKPTAPNADPEEDQHWNALSLPFVVGPKGRIGKLREDAIPTKPVPASHRAN